MSKRYGLSRKTFDKRFKLNSSGSIHPSQKSSSPPLIDDENLDDDLLHPSTSKEPSTPKQKSLLSKNIKKQTVSKADVNQPSTSTPKKLYFEVILEKNGVIFSTGDEVHSSKIESTILTENLKKYFKNDVNYPYNIDDFLKSFEKYIVDKKRFEKLLTCTIWLPAENTSDLEHVQLSIIQMLLNIDFLQVKIISILLDELSNYIMQDNLSDEIVWVRTILGQFRDLDFHVDGEVLAKNLIMLIEASGENEAAQYELICCLPRIILDPQHDLVAIELSRILADNFSLTGVILDNLDSLCVTKSIKEKLNMQVVELLRSESPMEKMHIITQYLISGNQDENAAFVIENLRENLDWGPLTSDMRESYKSERYTSQVLTFGIIRDTMSCSLLLSDTWFKLLLPIHSHKDFKSIDTLIFFILYITSQAKRKNNIEGLICKRISAGIIRQSLIENTFRDFYPVLRDNLKEMLNLFEIFIRHKQLEIAEFGGLCHKLFITHQDETSDMAKKSTNHITRTVLSDLVRHAHFCGFRGNTALSVLAELSICSKSIMIDNITLLMKLLYSINKSSLSRTRIAVDILCSTAYSISARNNGLSAQSEIEIFISKKLHSYDIQDNKKGIICCVAAVRHVANKHSDAADNDKATSSTTNSTFDPNGELSCGGPKEAATLIESMFITTKGDPRLQGLAYDELSSLIWIHSDKINKQIINWLCDTITNDFQQYYTTETLDDEIIGCKLEAQNCINPEEELIVNIATLVFKPHHTNNICILSPLFRLLRILHQIKFEGTLSWIDAVIGYAVAMPVIDINNGFEEFSIEQRKLVMDCIFHSINWFRECVSAFMMQMDDDIQARVFSRLKLLVKLEKQFYKLLSEIGVDYRPPLSNFHHGQVIEIIKHKKQPKAKAKGKNTDINETDLLQETNVRTQAAAKKMHTNKLVENQSAQIFRAFDNNMMLLLKKTLVMDENEASLTIIEVIYLLQDINSKLSILKGLKEQEHQPYILQSPFNLIKDIKPVIPYILHHLKTVLKVLTEALEECEIKDAHVMFFDKSIQAKACATVIFKILCEILEWSGFRNPVNSNLLRDILQDFSEASDVPQPINKLAIKAINSLSEYKSVIVTLPCASNYATLLFSLTKLTEDIECLVKQSAIYEELLSEEWYDEFAMAEKGKQCNFNLDLLLKYYFYKSDLKTIVRVINWIKEECSMLKKNTDNLKTFPNFYKSNFALLYRSVFAAFVQSIQDRIERPLSSTQHLRFWEVIMNTLGKLMAIVKEQDARYNICTFLKRSHEILKIFLNRGMKGLEVCLRSNTEEVTGILKTMQQSTRFINAICVQAKITKDLNLMAHVPKTLRVLESLIYSVKAALIANKCSTAFMMGNLINRNIHGDIIPTQSSYVTATNSEDELPPDDSESELDSDPDDTKMASRSKLY